MFDSLDEQLKHVAIPKTRSERLTEYIVVAVAIIVVLGGIIAAVSMMG